MTCIQWFQDILLWVARLYRTLSCALHWVVCTPWALRRTATPCNWTQHMHCFPTPARLCKQFCCLLFKHRCIVWWHSQSLVPLCCRGSFNGSTLLQEVHSYVQQNRPELHNQDYSIVSLHLGREFSADDLISSLADLGVQSQTSLRLRNKEPQTGETSTRLLSSIVSDTGLRILSSSPKKKGRCHYQWCHS